MDRNYKTRTRGIECPGGPAYFSVQRARLDSDSWSTLRNKSTLDKAEQVLEEHVRTEHYRKAFAKYKHRICVAYVLKEVSPQDAVEIAIGSKDQPIINITVPKGIQVNIEEA